MGRVSMVRWLCFDIEIVSQSREPLNDRTSSGQDGHRRGACSPENGRSVAVSNTNNLRVALVWNGTVFHEKTYTQTSEPIVTVGENERTMFNVPAPGVPESFDMFERTESGYVFRFTDKLDGHATVDDEELDFDELIEDGARSAGSGSTSDGSAKIYEVDIKPGDWGLVDLGEVNIFFQLNDKGEV